MLYEFLFLSAIYVRVFVHEGSAYWSIQQFRGHAGIGRNIGLVGERVKGNSFRFYLLPAVRGAKKY